MSLYTITGSLVLPNFTTGKPHVSICSLVVRMVQEKRRERERDFWVDRKTCTKKRIATDLYYYYDEIDWKMNACLTTACKLYLKRYSKKYTFKLRRRTPAWRWTGFRLDKPSGTSWIDFRRLWNLDSNILMLRVFFVFHFHFVEGESSLSLCLSLSLSISD